MHTKFSTQLTVSGVRRITMRRCNSIAYCGLIMVAVLCGCGPKVPSLNEVIHVSVRRSSLDSTTAVLQIQSEHNEALTLYGAVLNMDSKQQRKFTIGILEPNQSVELGLLEIGWAFEPNERFFIATTPDQPYKTIRFETYRTDSGSVGIRPCK
jgi:hypothetical protein